MIELEELDKNLAFKIKKEGKEIVCYIIFQFEDSKTGKKYVIYTDGTKNNDGTLEILASTYEMVDNQIEIGLITTDYEWDLVDKMLAQKVGELHGNK